MLRWVGAVTAVLSLIAGIYQLTRLVSDAGERRRSVAELAAVGVEQHKAGNYQASWNSFEQALALADEGGRLANLFGRLNSERQELRKAQEDLAMTWLQDVRVPEGRTFSDIVDPLLPILDRGTISALGERKADLLAHVGWAYFLKGRDAQAGPDPETYYSRALEEDSQNPYAHAYWGHWIAWQRRNVEEAAKHFSAAAAPGRALPFVRRMHFAALDNLPSGSGDGEILRLANEMRKNNEPIEANVRNEVYSIYSFAVALRGDDEDLQRLLAAVPAAEQIATIQAMLYEQDFDPSRVPVREACVALLQEAAGLPDEALQTWLAMRPGIPSGAYPALAARADAAIKRLSRKSRSSASHPKGAASS